MGMIDRQRVQQHIAVVKRQAVARRARIGRQIVMTEHRALGAAGGAGGVEDGGKVVRPARDVCESRPAAAPPARAGFRSCHRCPCVATGDTGDHVFAARRRDEQRRLRIRHEICQLRPRIGGVERQPDRAGPHGRPDRARSLRALLHLRRDPVAGLDPQRHQRIGQPGRQGPKPAIGQHTAVRRGDEGALWRCGRKLSQKMRNHGPFVRVWEPIRQENKSRTFAARPCYNSRTHEPSSLFRPAGRGLRRRRAVRRAASPAIRPISPASTRSSARRWRPWTARCWCWPAPAPARRAC